MKIIFLTLLLSISTAIASTTYEGEVVGITDGDTLTLLTAEKKQIKVRLAEIDTPEKRQPYGDKSRQTLSDMAFGKIAVINVQDTDRYGRSVARVFVGGIDVNREMVHQGAAWVYRQYNRDKSLLAVEAEAKAVRRGLWALPEAQRMSPWEWRRAKRNGGVKSLPAPAKTVQASDCGSKRYCKQMSSCTEARFYLEQCGLTRLDGDSDGVPCESLCR